MASHDLPPVRRYADDIYILASAEPHKDQGVNHSLDLLRAALEASKPQYGPYQLQNSTVAMQHKRLLRELAQGQLINVTVQVSNPEWEQALIPIRIPIDKGLASFRISLIDGRRQEEFRHINSLPQLRQLAVGVGEQWATRDVYEQNGLRVVTGTSSYPGLFGMLMAGRSDYLPRSIEEALREQPEQEANYPHLAIEQSFMRYFPVPRYYFVSPQTPRLAERLNAGLEKLIANGEFDRYFSVANLQSADRTCRIMQTHNIQAQQFRIGQTGAAEAHQSVVRSL